MIRKVSVKKRTTKKMHGLTWADLEAWAGTKIISRGTSYQKSGHVRDLAVTREGNIVILLVRRYPFW